ncbi:MAG: CPBP family intramembrane glutamic endopeptidase [Gemmatimonadales bacterium]
MGVFLRPDRQVRAWWRVAFFVLVTLAGGVVVATIAYEAISVTPLVGLAREYSVPLAEYGQLLGLLVGTYATVRVVDGVREGIWSRVGLGPGGLRPRWLLTGLAAGTLAILVPCGVLIAAGRFSFERQPAEVMSWWSAARGALFVLTPAALAEELAVRGYLLTTLVEGVGAPFAVAITSVLFALLHLLNPDPTFLSTGMVALAGLFLAVIRLTTGSLWAAWIAHLAWNLVQAVVLHAPVSGLPLATPGYRLVDHGPTWATGGLWGPEGGLGAAAGMLVATFLLVRYVKSGDFAPPARIGLTRGDVTDE